MKSFDIKGFIQGIVLATIASFFLLIVVALFKMFLIGTGEGAYSTQELYFYACVTPIFLTLSGYIISRSTKFGKGKAIIIVSIIHILSAIFPTDSFPFWYLLYIAVIAIPFLYLGSWLEIRHQLASDEERANEL